MDVEKMYNDWYEQAKKELEKKNILLSDCILSKDLRMSEPLDKQQEENCEFSIKLVLDYWINNDIKNSSDYLSNSETGCKRRKN